MTRFLELTTFRRIINIKKEPYQNLSMSEEAADSIKQDDPSADTPSKEPFVSDDSIVLDAFADVKGAILSRRTDIVREMLSAAQSSKILHRFYSENV